MKHIAKTKMKNATYHEDLIESLKDPEEAAYRSPQERLLSTLPEVFLVALRNVAEARGISKLARDTHLNRENLYKMLSKQGNPALGSLYVILDALGLKLSVDLKEES